MENILDYDEKIIGYKKDLIDYLKKEIERLRKQDYDDYIYIEDAIYSMNDYVGLINKLESKDNMGVYAICIGAMGDLNIYDVNIEIKY